jgi:hypothetical protein
VPRRRRQLEVDEPGAGEFGRRNDRIGRQPVDDRLSELARRFACESGRTHRDVAREVTVPGVSRALQPRIQAGEFCRAGGFCEGD